MYPVYVHAKGVKHVSHWIAQLHPPLASQRANFDHYIPRDCNYPNQGVSPVGYNTMGARHYQGGSTVKGPNALAVKKHCMKSGNEDMASLKLSTISIHLSLLDILCIAALLGLLGAFRCTL